MGSGLTCKHCTRLERLARDKRSCLLRTFVNYGRKKFYNIGPRLLESPLPFAKILLTLYVCASHRSPTLPLPDLLVCYQIVKIVISLMPELEHTIPKMFTIDGGAYVCRTKEKVLKLVSCGSCFVLIDRAASHLFYDGSTALLN